MAAAFELADFGCWRAIIESVVYEGLYAVGTAVLDGTFRKPTRERETTRKAGARYARSLSGAGRTPAPPQTKKSRKAYRNLARKYHPDNYHDNPLADLAQEKMKEINEAYETDPQPAQGRRQTGGQSGSTAVRLWSPATAGVIPAIRTGYGGASSLRAAAGAHGHHPRGT